MGIVKSQSVKNLITTYAGFGIGAVNTILLYPHFLGKTYYGVVMAVLATGSLLSAFVNFGMPDTLIKFFSSYKTEDDKRRLLGLGLVTPIFSGGLFGLFGLLFYQTIQDYFAESPEMDPFIWLIFVIAITEAYFKIFFNWGRIKLKSVFGNFMREVFHRALTMVLLFLVYLDQISIVGFLYALTTVYVLRSLIMMGYAFYLLPPKISFKLPKDFSRIVKYSVLILIAGVASNVLFDLDKTMIPRFMAIGNVSVYAIAVFIVTVIEVPIKSMRQITHPITANLMNAKKWYELEALYKKSSISLYTISGFLFAIIIANANQFYDFLSPEYHISLGILLLLALVKLSRNMLGIGGSILKNSDYYRLLLVSAVITIVLAFVLNSIMIPAWGLYGAAIASLSAFLCYDLLKMYFVYRKFKIQPFTLKTLILTVFIGIFTWIFTELEFHPNSFWGIAIKSTIMTAIYLPVIYFANFSEDVTEGINKILKKQKD